MSQTATQTSTGAWPIDRFEIPEQCAGYRVCDARGRKIGRLTRLFLNESGGAEYAEIKVGLFGLKNVVIPLENIGVDEGRRTLVLR